MPKNYFAANLKYLRTKSKQTQSDIALRLNKRVTAISSYENEQSEPGIEDLLILCDFFGKSLTELVTVDLQNVHLSEKNGEEKSGENVHPNVHANVHPTAKNEVKTGQNPQPYGAGIGPESFVINDEKEVKRPVLLPRVIHVDTRNEENAVFVPVRARAGYLQGYGDLDFMGSLPTYKIIGRRDKTYRIFEVDGNSMYPTLNDKDTVNAYAVSVSDIRDERIHVLVTRNDGLLIKRVINRYKEGKLICKSDNINKKGEYPPIVLPIHDIMEVWYVESRTSHNLTPPGEIYERISNVEATLAILMDNAGLLKGPSK